MLALYALTIFLGAALLFLVEPMVAKMALPLLGGSPAVWNTCVLFFQAALLAGYAWAHWSTRVLGPRVQALVQSLLMLAPLAVLPVMLRGTPPDGQGSPVFWLLMTLGAGAGLPFFVAATGAPLLQRWFAGSRHRSAADPYFLYAASNAGSLLALLAYPVVVEPHLTLADQTRWWSMGYALFAALTLACAGAAYRALPRAEAPEAASPFPPGARTRLLWVALAFIPSSLTLGTTQYLSTDIAAVPLLWVVPLAIYLLTFVLAFSPRPPLPIPVVSRLLPAATMAVAIVFLVRAMHPAWMLVLLHLSALFIGAMLCHLRLARSRPNSSRLTEFYLLIALGGALGGLFNAVVAPRIFSTVAEYPILIVLALLVRPREPSRFDSVPRPLLHLVDFAIPVMIGGLGLWLDDRAADQPAGIRLGVTVGIPAILCYIYSPRPIGFALAIGAMCTLAIFAPPKEGAMLARTRTFFGVYTVRHSDVFNTLMHGTTLHGLQYTSAHQDLQGIPLGYYHPEGPIGQVFTTLRASPPDGQRPLLDHVGLVGMGTGALAAYGRSGQRITFHEIDPAVVAIAKDDRYFTYLRDCKASWDVALGDGRLTLAAAPNGEYGLIVLDAFSSDAIPIHLLSREAVEVYLKKLRPHGLIAVHISNQYLDLEPVLGRIAEALGIAGLVRRDDVSERVQRESGRYSCVWVLLARDRADFGPLAHDARWLPILTRRDVPVWTDDYSNIWSIFRWK